MNKIRGSNEGSNEDLRISQIMESKHQVIFNGTIAYLILKGKKFKRPQNIKVKKQIKKDDLFMFKHGVQNIVKIS